jgi:hypothetical protein
MKDKTERGMTMSSDAEAMLLAVKARIKDVPAGETLIDSIPDADWLDADVSNWMVNSGSDATGQSDELDDCDKEAMKVA